LSREKEAVRLSREIDPLEGGLEAMRHEAMRLEPPLHHILRRHEEQALPTQEGEERNKYDVPAPVFCV
jgi:hypothetical protein